MPNFENYGMVSIMDFGAVGDGVTDDTAAFIAARQYAEARVRNAQVSQGNVNQRGSVSIFVPGGAYLITQPEAMLSDSFTGNLVIGLQWIGEGEIVTEIIYRPTLVGGTPNTPMLTNQRWSRLKMKGFQFTCDTPGAWFMHSNNPGGVAVGNYSFYGCNWQGAWGGGFYLTGSNNNSEWYFYDCQANHFRFGGPFLHATSSDQFLTYHFYGFKYWNCTDPFIRMTLGGHVHIWGFDASHWCEPTAPGAGEGFLFELLGTNHARGVCSFSAHQVRVEAQHAAAKLLKSEWPHGSVNMQNVDYSSAAGSFTYGDIIDLQYANEKGATYSFRDCTLAGTVMLRASSAAHDAQHTPIEFTNCRWWFKDKPSDIINYTVPTNSGGRPVAKFRNCGPLGNQTAGHMFPWDADIGARFARGAALGEEKLYALRASNTSIPTTYSQRVRLPIGSIVTGFSAYGKPGQSAETTTATYSLKSTEGAPTTIAQVAASNPSTARAYTETPTNLPWFCDAANTADLDVVAEADVGAVHNDLLFVIRYI